MCMRGLLRKWERWQARYRRLPPVALGRCSVVQPCASITRPMEGTAIACHPISVVLDGPPTPRWQQRALDGLRARASLEVREVRFAGAPRHERLRDAHAAFERRLFAAGPDATAPAVAEPGGEALAGDVELVVWLAETPPPAGQPVQVLELRHNGSPE